jgi:hypothetical protein
MEGFADASIDQLISIAAKVVANQEEIAKREKEKYLEKNAKILTMALKEGDRKTGGQKGGPNRRERRNPLGKNQCTYCKEEGHWKNECPNKKKKEKEIVAMGAAKSKEACNLETNTSHSGSPTK